MGEFSSALVAQFLLEFKAIAVSRGIDVIPRRLNLDTLAWLGLTRRNQIDELIGLSVTDYCKGPEADKDKPGDVWVFGKQIEQQDIYIKIKIAQTEQGKIAKCLSFHIAVRPLTYPFRNESMKGDQP